MGPVFFDFDNTGKVDLWVSDSKYNRLLRNTGKLPFVDITQQAGISQLPRNTQAGAPALTISTTAGCATFSSLTAA
jgi:hypothetical protein